MPRVRPGQAAVPSPPFVELLAPAGSPDALRAAVAAGADAVYLGLGVLNARAANNGLTLDELARGCLLAHAHGARVYVTLNVYVHDRELDAAVALARAALGAGADALIVADAGLCLRLRAELPGVELHLSTQAGVQSEPAALLAAHEFGVERVTCARELSVAEIAELCAAGVRVEAFCHGAICICYSGACSYSALLRGRSANRGDCAQPCRLAYELQDAEGTVLAGGLWRHPAADGGTALAGDAASLRAGKPSSEPIASVRAGVASSARGSGRAGSTGPVEGDRLLCPRDYLGIRHISELVAAGVHALKIEGRMKGADYVYNVVGCYRRALDAALSGRELSAAEFDALEAQLARSFSRGFTDGYLADGHTRTGADLMSSERAINQGLPVGRIAECRHEEVTVELSRAVGSGDMLEIRSTPGPDAPADVPKRWPIVSCPVDAAAGERVVLRCKRKVEQGSAVHLVRSASAVAEAARAVAAMRAEEDALVARAAGSEGRECDAPAAIRAAGGWGCASDVPVAVRATGCGDCAGDALMVARSADSGGRERDSLMDLLASVVALSGGGPAELHAAPISVAYSANRVAGRSPAHLGRLPVLDLGEVCRVSDVAAARRACARVMRGEAEAVICRNLAQVQVALEAGVLWEAAPPLNVWNAETARWLASLGARRIWLPEELCAQDERELRAAFGDTFLDLRRVPAGSTPLMITEHCLLTAEGPCAGECVMCVRRIAAQQGERFLVELDRKSAGARLRVEVDEHGRTRLFRTTACSAVCAPA